MDQEPGDKQKNLTDIGSLNRHGGFDVNFGLLVTRLLFYDKLVIRSAALREIGGLVRGFGGGPTIDLLNSDTATDGDLRAFLDWRCGTVTALVAEIRASVRKDATVAVIPSVARPTGGAWYEGSDLAALAEACGIIEACFYEPGAARVKADLFDIKRRLDGHGTLRGIMRPAFPDFTSKGEFLAAASALVEGGVTGLAFYNWGHVREANMAWIADAMKLLEGQT